MVVVLLVQSLISSAGQDLGKENLPRLVGLTLLVECFDVGTAVPPITVVPSIRGAVLAIDNEQPVNDERC